MSWKRISVDRADEIAAAMDRRKRAEETPCPTCDDRGEIVTSTLDPSIGVWMPDTKPCPTCSVENDVIPYEP